MDELEKKLQVLDTNDEACEDNHPMEEIKEAKEIPHTKRNIHELLAFIARYSQIAFLLKGILLVPSQVPVVISAG